jgi:hypothetical protein
MLALATRSMVALLLAVTWATTSAAEQYSQWGSVQELEAGWAQDTMAVRHSAPMVNPDGCPVTNAGYATNPADTGHSLFHTVLLSAFLNRKEVALLISGCVYSKPRIIAVKIH